MKKKALVVGSFVSKSVSPIIFNYWFEKHNIDANYDFREIEEKNFNEEINNILNDKEIIGFNVTIPFKELIKNKLSSFDEHSKEIGAVNCVSRHGKSWVGKNTDWVGFCRTIKQSISEQSKKTAVVLGYGGAAKAIVYSLKKSGFKKIKIYNRTKSKIKKFNVGEQITTIDFQDISKEIKDANIVINTIPVNILQETLAQNDINEIFACDIVYNPKTTNFLNHFKKEKHIYGISMLVHQAAPCFEEWFGVKPIVDEGLWRLLDRKIKQ